MINLGGVDVDDIDALWGSVSFGIEEALAYANGEYSLDDIYDCLKSREMQLWVGYDDKYLHYVCVTTIEKYISGKKSCHVVALAGKGVAEWLEDGENEMCSWAIDRGCDEIRITGRPGWTRILNKLGYEHNYVVMTKSLMAKH